MIRATITIEDPIFNAGKKIAAKRGFGKSFSAYILWLINRDAEGGVTREDTPVVKAPAKGTKTAKHPAKRGK